MSVTFTDPRTGETYVLRRLLDRPDMLLSPCRRVHLAGNDYGFLTAQLWLPADTEPHPVVEFSVQVRGSLTNPPDVQSALWALEGAIAGRKLAEENKRLREVAESARFLSDVFARLDRTGDLVIDVAGGVSAQFEVGEAIDRLRTALTKEAPDA